MILWFYLSQNTVSYHRNNKLYKLEKLVNKKDKVLNKSAAKKFELLLSIMKRLRSTCPWDKQQTHASLRRYIMEEAHESIDKIDHQDWQGLAQELGDLLLQIVFQSTIAEEEGYFTIEEVIDHINKKMVERHPHVFDKKKVSSAREVEANWDKIKINTENRDSILSEIPLTLPSLLQAQKIQEKVARIGFDWPELEGVIEKINEEISELGDALKDENQTDIEEEIGDLFFSLTNLTRRLNIVAEDALRQCNNKFIARFQFIENQFDNDYEKLKSATLEELDQLWEKAKETNGR
jgi:tetrapyrrole methylase family protein/MazG family protein